MSRIDDHIEFGVNFFSYVTCMTRGIENPQLTGGRRGRRGSIKDVKTKVCKQMNDFGQTGVEKKNVK
jgi:hypothetical protein